MRKSITEGMTITISRFGHDNLTIELAEDSTVADALSAAGITPQGNEQLFVAGEAAESADILEDGDVLSIVTPKQAG